MTYETWYLNPDTCDCVGNGPSADVILAELTRRDVRVWKDGAWLGVTGPSKSLSRGNRALLRKYARSLMQHLTRCEQVVTVNDRQLSLHELEEMGE